MQSRYLSYVLSQILFSQLSHTISNSCNEEVLLLLKASLHYLSSIFAILELARSFSNETNNICHHGMARKNIIHKTRDSSDIGNRSVYTRLSHLVLRIATYDNSQACARSPEGSGKLHFRLQNNCIRRQ